MKSTGTSLKGIAYTALIGLWDALYLSIERVRGGQLVCLTGSGCDLVQNSAYSAPLGIPVAFVGVLFYFVIAIASLVALKSKEAGTYTTLLVGLGAVGAAVTGLYLIPVQAFVIGAWCSWCLLSAGCEFIILWLVIKNWRNRNVNDTTRRQKGRQAKTTKQGFHILYLTVALFGTIILLLVTFVGKDASNSGATANASSLPSSDITQFAPYQVKGDANAPITVYEFSDYECPACTRFALSGENEILKPYIDAGQIKLIFHDFPLGQHDNAIPAAVAARAAGQQGKFWEMEGVLFQNQQSWAAAANPTQAFKTFAQQIGLNMPRFEQALNDPQLRRDVIAAQQEASILGVSFTPAFRVNDGEVIDSSQLEAEIQKALTEQNSRTTGR